MVWKVSTDIEARQTTGMLRMFRERLKLLDLERTSIAAIIAAHEEQLVDYHKRIREMLAREESEGTNG